VSRGPDRFFFQWWHGGIVTLDKESPISELAWSLVSVRPKDCEQNDLPQIAAVAAYLSYLE
jgi:hypothetical protein